MDGTLQFSSRPNKHAGNNRHRTGKGGRSLALLTLGVWALPMILLMGCLSFIPQVFGSSNSFPVWLEFLVPMAAGFVAWAAWQIGRKVVTDKLTIALWAQGFAVVLMSGSPWGIPLILLSGGILGIVWVMVKRLNRK